MGGRRAIAVVAACVAFGAARAQVPDGRDDDATMKAMHDRAAPLGQFELDLDHNRPPRGEGENGFGFELDPTIPIRQLGPLPRSQLVLSLPFGAVPDGGVGDLEVYDTFVVDLPRFGSVGVGPAMIAPTATRRALGQGKWQLGVAPVVSYTALDDWTIGFTARNYTTIGGAADRPDVAALLVQPTLTRTFADGWFVGHSDFDWEVDWHGGDVTLPLGVQIGRSFRLGGVLMSLSAEAAYSAVRPTGTDAWLVTFEFIVFHPALAF